LLDRALQERAGHRAIREWVAQVRALERQSRAGIGATVALSRESQARGESQESGAAVERTDNRSGLPDDSAFAEVLARLQAIGPPSTEADRATVSEIAALLESWGTGHALLQHAPGHRGTKPRRVASGDTVAARV
jgi:hypothetical protein